MMVEVVSPGRRLGTSGVFPAASTGWNDTADGENSSRVLFCTICRVTYGWRAPLSLWHLKQTSYSYCALGSVAPAVLMPSIAPRFGEISGALAVPPCIVCPSWQSLHTMLLGM